MDGISSIQGNHYNPYVLRHSIQETQIDERRETMVWKVEAGKTKVNKGTVNIETTECSGHRK